MSKTYSAIWKREPFLEAVRESSSIAEVLRKIGLNPSGQNYYTFYKHRDWYGADTSHFQHDAQANFGPPLPDREMFTENSSSARATVKRRIIRDRLLPCECQSCGLGTEWNGSDLTLHLDHINGVGDDHRLENLRFLCPNCHSQTKTYGARNKTRPVDVNDEFYMGRYDDGAVCPDCSGFKLKTSSRCRTCNNAISTSPTKIEWPAPSEVEDLVFQHSMVGLERVSG